MSKKKVSFINNPLFGGPTLENRSRTGSPYRELPIDHIDVDPDQPRRLFDEDALKELSSSIAEHGVLCPILVRVADGGTFRLVAGERRLRASKLAGLQTIPAVIDSSEDTKQTLAKQLVENLQRENLTPMERALAIGQLRDDLGLSIREIAVQLGVSKGLVQRSLEILTLPEDLQAALINGASESKILLISKVEDIQKRKILLDNLSELTRAQIEDIIKGRLPESEEVYHGGTEKVSSQQEPLSLEDQRIVDSIQRTLGTKVKLARAGKDGEKGKLVLEFYSNEELAGIYQRLVD